MTEIKNCPSLLIEGFDTYSPKAIKTLFKGIKANPMLNFNIDEFRNAGKIAEQEYTAYLSQEYKKNFRQLLNQERLELLVMMNDRRIS